MRKYVIYNTDEELFWNNSLGWVDFRSAEYFEKRNIYFTGNWIWVKIKE